MTLNQDVKGKKQSDGKEVGRRVLWEGAQQGKGPEVRRGIGAAKVLNKPE